MIANNKTYILLFFSLLLVSISSCDRDDICVEPVTPQLILRFYDNIDVGDLKDVANIKVWSEGRDTLFNNRTTDSIYIPLDTTFPETEYFLKTEDLTDTLTINYTNNQVFVTRSCGYKGIFEDISTTTTENWIENITIIENTIENENQAHIHIFH